MKTLFIAWQNPSNRKWFTVGRLRRVKGTYEFSYTRGVLRAGPEFIPFGRFRDLNQVYVSDQLFPLFSNRTLPESRPDYHEFLDWLALPPNTSDPVEVLARSGGKKATDSLEIFPCPVPNRLGQAELEFFVHGVRYLPVDSLARISRLREGEQLFLMFDVQNPVDPLAVAVRTDDPPLMIGYSPRYLAHDLRQLLWREGYPETASLSVLRVNEGAPLQFRLLCRLIASWPAGFEPCVSDEYQAIEGNSEVLTGSAYYAQEHHNAIPRRTSVTRSGNSRGKTGRSSSRSRH
jgi:HIRAN domain